MKALFYVAVGAFLMFVSFNAGRIHQDIVVKINSKYCKMFAWIPATVRLCAVEGS